MLRSTQAGRPGCAGATTERADPDRRRPARLRSVLAPLGALATAAALVLAACAPSDADPPLEGEAGNGLAGATATAPDLTRVEGLGSLSFPVTGSPEAVASFHRGVLLLHSFEYERAARAFRAARAADPGLVMAYWGEAMTHNHPVWMEQDREAALAVLGELAPTPGERLARAPTERERMYLAAVEALYSGEGSKEERDFAYLDAMEALHRAHPDDDEARAFYALAQLGTAHGGRDFAIYMRAAATAQPVFDRNPEHPGAAHYLIHSFDDPVHAPLGLSAARSYGRIAPRAGHAQHMTSHIFVAMGMWDDVVRANIAARAVQDSTRAGDGLPPNACGHYATWLHYGYLMQGDGAEAATALERCLALAADAPAARSGAATMRARHVIDRAAWDEPSRWTSDWGPALEDDHAWAFADAFAAVRSGDAAAGRRFLDRWRPRVPAGGAQREWALVDMGAMEAAVAAAEGRTARALELVQEAAQAEEALPFEFGPPWALKPTRELQGELLLEAGRPADAAVAFERALARTPGRLPSARGLEAAEAALSGGG